jgi:hypothetical protein
MRDRHHSLTAALFLVTAVGVGACGGHSSDAAANNAAMPNGAVAPNTVPVAHHSKLGGALVGAAVGHVLGGHAVAGAAAGAMVQHERNKHQ